MIEIDRSALPQEIKEKAREYCEKSLQHSYADTREELEEDVIAAWLDGFAFCLEGKVQEHRKNFEKEVCDLIYCVEHCNKNELAIARQITRVRKYLEPTTTKVEGDWVVRDKEPL